MTNTILNIKISEVEDKISDGMSSTVFNEKIEEVETKMQNVNCLVKKP